MSAAVPLLQPLPSEVAFGPRDHLDPQLSPDGRYVSFLAPYRGVSNVWVRDLNNGHERPITAATSNPIGGIFSYVSAFGRSVWHRWAFDGSNILYLTDQGGDERFHVVAVDITTGGSRDLTPYEGIQAIIVGLSPDAPDHVVVQMGIEDPTRLDLYRIRIADGATEVLAENLDGATSWVLNRQLQLVGMVRPLDSGGEILEVTDGATRRSVLATEPDEGGITTFGVDDKGRFVVATALGSPTSRVLLVDPDSGLSEEPFAADPIYDVSHPLPCPSTGVVDMVRILRARPATEGNAGGLKALAEAVPGSVVVCRSLDDSRWLVEVPAADGPVRYGVFDRGEGAWRELFVHQEALSRCRLASQLAITFAARDGLTLHGYVVAPPGVTPLDLATIVLVHGGPAQRHGWGMGDPYLPLAQWFATRGYLVLMVDFRGSNGYGPRFERAIRREWGGASLTDCLDGVDYVSGQGWADPTRVAFVGASFGGYTALAAAAFAGERVRAAVAIAGISDLRSMVEQVPPEWRRMRRHWVEMLGDPDLEPEFLSSRSPISRADDIDVPLLLVHGANDTRVNLDQTRQLVTALERRGVDVEHLVFEDEGHLFTKPSSWLATLDATERFLGRHLPV